MIYIFFALGYYLIFCVLLYGFIKTGKRQIIVNNQKATIIICARNEESRITPLLESLEKIDYSLENYEILLVNDDSTDKTEKIMESFCKKHSNWKYLLHKKTNLSYKGKKGALDFGIQKANFDIIITTDADCVVQKNWLSSMLSYFDKDAGMVQGYSPVNKRPDFLSIYQQFDTMAEGVTAASSMYFNNPTHANARNFAFRKSVYNEVGGFEKISHVDTGDDFFLAKLIKNETDYKFRYNADSESHVFTDEIENLKEYWHQQLRRNSKGFDLNLNIFIMGSWLLIFHLLLIHLFISQNYNLFVMLIVGKFIVEFLPVIFGVLKFNEKRILAYFPILWILYPIFYFSSQILGSFRLYKWK